MSVKEIKAYIVSCDYCGEFFSDNDFDDKTIFDNKKKLNNALSVDDWSIEKETGNVICSYCKEEKEIENENNTNGKK